MATLQSFVVIVACCPEALAILELGGRQAPADQGLPLLSLIPFPWQSPDPSPSLLLLLLSLWGGMFSILGIRLMVVGGVVWCWNCGSWAISLPRALCKPCRLRPIGQGPSVLARLRKGLTPIASLKQWPEAKSPLGLLPGPAFGRPLA